MNKLSETIKGTKAVTHNLKCCTTARKNLNFIWCKEKIHIG